MLERCVGASLVGSTKQKGDLMTRAWHADEVPIGEVVTRIGDDKVVGMCVPQELTFGPWRAQLTAIEERSHCNRLPTWGVRDFNIVLGGVFRISPNDLLKLYKRADGSVCGLFEQDK